MRFGVGTVLALALVALLLLLTAPRLSAQPAAGRIAAATENELATKQALAQMQDGGNAIDAAVTAALVGGVASPTSSGIGGGGFVVAWLAQEQRAFALDFRETAPAGVDASAFEARPFAASERAKLTGVPGELAGLYELHRRFGKRGWKDVVAPAARIAKSGFAVGPHLAAMLNSSSRVLKTDPAIAAVFYRGGKPAAAGKRVQNPKLAATLERIAAEGPRAFYEGPIAAEMVESANKLGGALTLAELSAYKPIERTPLHVKWEGYDVYTMPPPSAGGLMIAQALGIYSAAELKRLGWASGAYQHMLAEVLRAAIADRMRHLGDPDHESVDLARLLDPKRLAARKKMIALDRTHALPRFGLEQHGTHHLLTADAEGNLVSLTTTVNRVFGAKIATPNGGVVLNDELDDFTKAKDVAPFGMSRSPNRPRPGARPVSSMTPTVVVRGGSAVLGLGGSGGPTITTNVTQVLLSRLIFGHDPATAVSAPRFQIPTRDAFILVERGSDRKLIEDLETRGEIVGTVRFTSSAVQMIAIENGRKLPASDPRKHGSAAAR
jgi:gamma-glutamyltranspeptidase / glutathione hydrolase